MIQILVVVTRSGHQEDVLEYWHRRPFKVRYSQPYCNTRIPWPTDAVYSRGQPKPAKNMGTFSGFRNHRNRCQLLKEEDRTQFWANRMSISWDIYILHILRLKYLAPAKNSAEKGLKVANRFLFEGRVWITSPIYRTRSYIPQNVGVLLTVP